MTIWKAKNPFGRGSIALMAAVLFVTILVGCDSEQTHNLISERASTAQEKLAETRSPQVDAKHYNPLVVTDKVWSGSSATRMYRGMPLPAHVETPKGITLVSGQPLSLTEIATAITTQTGIPVRVSETGARGGAPSEVNLTRPNTPGGGVSANPNLPNIPPPGGLMQSVTQNDSSNKMVIAYEGPLSGLLERVAGYFGVNWHYDGTSVHIARFETRVFMVEALPETATVQDTSQTSTSSSSGSSSGGSGGGSSGGSSSSGSSSQQGSNSSTGTLTQNLSYTTNIKYWDELKDILNAMLGDVGNVVISPSNGEVTVTTTPEIMRTVADYLAQENKRLSRQIAINVEIYSVNVSRDFDFNLDFGAAIGRLDNVVNVKTVAGPSGPASAGSLSGLGSLSIAILNPDHSGKISDVFSALATVGDTSTLAQFPLTTVNNRPVSRFVGTTQYFVPQITGSSTSTVGTTSTIGGSSAAAVPISSGLTLQMTPRLLDDGRIVMQYSLNIQDITSIQCFNICTGVTAVCSSSGGTNEGTACTLQEPITNNRSFIQQSVLRSGSTLVIGGVDQENVSQNANGEGDPFFWFLGGGISNANGRTMVVIAISPQVLDPPAPEQGL